MATITTAIYEGRVIMCAFISLILLALGILGGSEMFIVASGLFAIGAELKNLIKKESEKHEDMQ